MDPRQKCSTSNVSHPGVEPEPFEMGEHLVEASGKLCLLDSMLNYLHTGLVALLGVCLPLLVGCVGEGQL